MKDLYIIILLLGLNIPCWSQSFQDSITSELTELVKNSHLIGFSTAIVNKDGILYAKGFGYANKERKTPYTINTVQPIASISKTLLAVALMKAQEMGKLHLYDNINDYLPFKIYNPNFPKENITIQQLANHTSSILDGDSYDRTYVFKNDIPPFYNNFTDEKLKVEIKKWVELFNANEMMPLGEFIQRQYVKDQIWYNKNQNFSKNKPGSTYKYSNMGANIAAYIIEQTTGEKYAEFIQKQILDPLQMNNTGWSGKNYEPRNTSILYWYGYPMPKGDLVTYPDGNLMTNVVDYATFLSTMIRGYKEKDNLLSSDSYLEMMKSPATSDFRKGVFWSVDSEKIGHSGSDLGLLSHAYFLRKNGIGMIVFVNTSDVENNTTDVRDIYRILSKYAKNQ